MAREIAGVAEDDGEWKDEDDPIGLWGFLRTAVWRGLPYLFLLAVSLVGICWANVVHDHSTAFWVFTTPVFGLVCILIGWRNSTEHHTRIRLVILQSLQWVGVMVAMYLVGVSDLRDLLNDDARALMMLTLLALGVFISGLNLEVWQLVALGMFLAVAVPMIAWVEAASVLLILLAALIIVVALGRLWVRHRYFNKPI
jgi:hypothetical protein